MKKYNGIFRQDFKSKEDLMKQQANLTKEAYNPEKAPKTYKEYKKGIYREERKQSIERAKYAINDTVNTIAKGARYKSHTAPKSYSSGFARGRGLERRKIL